MSLSARRTERTFNFVMTELVRHSKMSWGEMKGLGLAHFLSPQLLDADGTKWTIGEAAARELKELTELALDDSPFRRRVDPREAYQAVLKGYASEYLRPGRGKTRAAEDRANLSPWIATAGENCAPLTHFIPCNIGLKGAGTVQIGPVRIGARSEIAPRFNDALAASRTEESRRRPDGDLLLADMCEDYLNAFSDIAEVTVPACDPTTSRQAAEEAVQAAVNTVHLIAGVYDTQAMRAGGPARPYIKTANVALRADGTADLHFTKSWEGASIHSSFWATLKEPDRVAMLDAVGVAVSTVLNRTDPEFVAARYLDAVAWYADAVTERAKPAAIVKYLTAMERLLWTGETGSGITRRLSDRTAALCFSTEIWNFQELSDEVRRAYDLRSGIVHGRLSASNPEILKSHRLCKKVARDLLITWLSRYGEGFATPTTIEKAKAHFDGFVAEVQAETAKRRKGRA